MSSNGHTQTCDLGIHREPLRALAACLIDRQLWGVIDPSDLAQETLMKGADALSRGHVVKDEWPWLSAILRNRYRDELRHLKQRRAKLDPQLHLSLDNSSARLEASIVAESLNPVEEAVRNEELARLVESLAQLPEQERDVVIRHRLHEQSIPEVSQETGIPVNVLAGRFARGIKRLRKLLGG